MLWLILLVLLFAAVISFNQYTKNKKKYKAGEMGETEVYQLITQIAPRSSVILRNIYLPTSKGTTETDLLMLTRKGIFVFEIKNYRGVIYGDERYNEWIKVLGNGKKYLSIILCGKMRAISGHYCVCFQKLIHGLFIHALCFAAAAK